MFDGNHFDNGFGIQETEGHCEWMSMLLKEILDEIFPEMKASVAVGHVDQTWLGFVTANINDTTHVLDITGDQFGYEDVMVFPCENNKMYYTIHTYLTEKEISKSAYFEKGCSKILIKNYVK